MLKALLLVSMASWVLGACGGDDGGVGHLADAPPPPSDGPEPDAGPVMGPVTLTVTQNGAPRAGVHVYFLNADSSVVATKDTGADGKASAVMVAGGSVTALDPFAPLVRPAVGAVADNNNDLRTFMGVKPGDDLVLSQTDFVGTTVTFTLSAKAPTIASNSYLVFTTCGTVSIATDGRGIDPSSEITLPGENATSDCHGVADIVIEAREFDGESNNVVGALYHENVAVTGGGKVDLSADEYKPFEDVSFRYMHAPQDRLITVERTIGTAHGRFGDLALSASGLPDIEGNASFPFETPAVPGATRIVDTIVDLNGRHHVVESVTSNQYTLDLTSVLLPDLRDAPFYNPATQRMSWHEETAATVRPDATTLGLEILRDNQRWTWAVAAPWTPGGELLLPRLPTDVRDFNPQIKDAINIDTLRNAQVPGGYDKLRPHVHDIADVAGFAPQAGRAVVVELRSFRGAGAQRSAALAPAAARASAP
ncbi:MAG TPA: hypothetical protein VFK02_33255 [Kofleriaceae bacterium]|nr:hypothetical protein [Kofleriaceae bacterium]